MSSGRFAVTFGTQYGRITHPVFPMLTGESYVVLNAPFYEAAHQLAMRLFGVFFAFLYDMPYEGIARYGLQDMTPEVLSYLVAGDRLHGAVKMDHVKEGSNE